MEQRDILRGPAVPGRVTGSSAFRAVPWFGVLLVMSAITYGLQLFGVAIAPAASAEPTSTNSVVEGQAGVPGVVLQQRGLQLDLASWSSRPTVVLITGSDRTTGDRRQLQSDTDSARIAGDVLLLTLIHI
jgi:hypothetical protein